jgi:hypothetical protein
MHGTVRGERIARRRLRPNEQERTGAERNPGEPPASGPLITGRCARHSGEGQSPEAGPELAELP